MNFKTNMRLVNSRRYFLSFSIMFATILFISGCSQFEDQKDPTIALNTDSDYHQTFENLNLGYISDFDFHLPDADKRWVNIWVERYIDGVKDSEPITQLSYGNSPNNLEEGSLGFGMINPYDEDTLVFLYAPGVSTHPSIIEKEKSTNSMSSWENAIGEDKVALKIGEPIILAAYRQTEKDSISSIDFQNEESINRIIKEDDMVILLKIVIEESDAVGN
ncbi:hypothetical protein [Sutcliffiella horikoshii]|uniref:hypothetical protein n=1 Tax=Sutcliffiella horikoshii TaxID=79883 RepID=UPI001CFE314D|nr:hypothetical protein [Sutcliffiella horikoshii]